MKREGTGGRIEAVGVMRTDGVGLVNYSESREKRCTHPLICKARKEERRESGGVEEPKPKRRIKGAVGRRRRTRRAAEKERERPSTVRGDKREPAKRDLGD